MNRRYNTRMVHRTILLWSQQDHIGRNMREAFWLNSERLDHIRKLGNANALRLKPRWRRRSVSLAYLLGVLMGDGCLAKNSVVLETIDREFADLFAGCLERQFGRKPSIYRRPGGPWLSNLNGKTYVRRPYLRAELCSREAVRFLKSIKYAHWVRSLSKPLLTAWLRGMWDSEGCIYQVTQTKLWAVCFVNTDSVLANLFAEGLLKVARISAIPHRSKGSALWSIRIWRQDAIVRFFDIVQPTIRRKRRRFELARRRLSRRRKIHRRHIGPGQRLARRSSSLGSLRN